MYFNSQNVPLEVKTANGDSSLFNLLGTNQMVTVPGPNLNLNTHNTLLRCQNPAKGKPSGWRRKALPMALHEPAACVSSVMWERRKRKKKKPLQSSRLWLLFGAKYSLGFLLRPYFFAWEWNNDLCKISVALEMKQIIFLNLEMAKRPFYSCLFSCLAFEWKWRWRWPCFDRNVLTFLCLWCCSHANE